jgi:hypothetical protein
MAVCSTANRSEGGKNHTGAKLPFNGKTIYVAGGKLYEIEDRIQELEPDWLGAKNSRELTEGHAFLAKLASGH